MTNLTDTNDQMDRVDGFRLEAEPEVPPVPACVELAKLPKTRQAEVVCEAMGKLGGTVLT